MLAPPKIYLWCFSRDMHDETHCILQLLMQWVWSCKFCMHFKEAVSLQHIEHSCKHAVFFSEEVQFPFRKLFSLRSIIQYFFQNTRFLLNMQCVINIEYCCENVQWLMLITAFLGKKDCCWRKMLLTGYNLPWRQDSPLNEKHYFCKKVYVKKWTTSFMELSLPLIFLLWPFFNERLIYCLQNNCPEDNVFPQITSNMFAEKEYNIWKDAIHSLWSSASLWMTVVFKGKTQFLQNYVAYFVQVFHSYERAFCMHTSVTCIFQKVLHTPAGSTSK